MQGPDDANEPQELPPADLEANPADFDDPPLARSQPDPPEADEELDEEDLDEEDLDEEDYDDEDLEEELEASVPWNPPTSAALEPEWQVPPPRAFDKKDFQGSHQINRRLQVLVSVLSGAILIAASYLPAVRAGAVYLPLLSWLLGLGVALVLLGASFNLISGGVEGPFRYLRDGVAMLVRVKSIRRKKDSAEDSSWWSYVVKVEAPDPSTGRLETREIESPKLPGTAVDSTECTYRPGEYVTAVYLPEDREGTLTLYGFLGLRKDLGILRSDERSPSYVAEVGLGCAVLWLFLGGVLWGIYVLFRYFPLDMDFAQAFPWILGGGLGIGIPLTFWHSIRLRRKQSAAAESGSPAGQGNPSTSAGGAWVGLPFTVAMWGGLVWVVAMSVNALMDSSPAVQQPIIIRQLLSHESKVLGLTLLRDARVEYQVVGERFLRRTLSTPEEMATLRTGDASAEIHAGRLGWRWVDRITMPADPAPALGPADP
jgi:hypothetical protein